MEPDVVHIIECVIALLAAIVAYWQHRRMEGETERADAIISFFDPVAAARSPVAPPGVSDRSWRMTPSTRAFLTRGLTEEERALILGQVDQAELEGRVRYTVSSPSAWYEIEYGLVKAGGRRDDLLPPGSERNIYLVS